MSNSSLHRLIIGMVVASCFGIATLVVMAQPALAAVVIWNVDSDGDWHAAGNWSSNPSLPGSGDDVTIDRTTAVITVTHSLGSDTINSLTCNEALVLSGGSLTINNAAQINKGLTINGGTANFNSSSVSTVSGVSTFSSGTIGGSGPVSFDNLTWIGGGFMTGTGSTEILDGKSLTLSGAGYHSLARTIDNYGNTTVIGSSGLNPNSGGSTPTFNNKSDGIFDLQSTGGLDPYSLLTGVFNNEGTFRKTTSTGTASVSTYWTLNNPGTVQVQSGTLNVSGAFNNTGTAEVQAGNTMSLSGGGTSTGTFNVLSGATLNFSGGTHSLGGATFSNAGMINFNSGMENFNGTTPTIVPGAATLSSGTLGGSGIVYFNNLTWTNGTMSGSGTTMASGFIFSGGGDPLLDGRTLSNAGTATFSSATYLHGKNGAVFNNLKGAAVVDLQGTNDFKNDGGTLPVVNNDGMFRKSTSTGSITIAFAMNNSGTVEVQTGTLNLSAGGTSWGTFNVLSGATLNFSGGTHSLGGATFSNAGTINFNGGTENFDGSMATTVPGAVVLSGVGTTLGGSGTVNFNNLTWTGGTMSGSGITTVSTGVIFSGGGDPMLDGRTLNNSGTATFSSTNYLHGKNGAVFNNLAGAMVDLQGANAFVNGGGTLPVVNNAGTFRKSTSTGNINIGFAMNNTGAVEVQSGGLTFQSTATQLVGDTLTGGTWNVKANSTLNITTGSNIITNQGNVTLDGLASTFTKINTLANNQGSFNILDGRNFTTAGNLANSGTLTVGSGSDFEVSGDLTGAGNLSVSGILTADSIVQNTLTIGAGATVTIRPISGGPLAAQFQISTVPEPATITLLLLAGAGIGLWRLRRRDVGIV